MDKKSPQKQDQQMDPKKDKSRNAAKSRRLTESEVFAQLEQSLPTIDRQTIYQVDRIAILRLVLMICRLRRVAERFLYSNALSSKKPSFDKTFHDLICESNAGQCLDGFIMVVNKGGQLMFVTSSVAECLGFTQTDLIGRYLRDYVHVDDWPEVRDRLCKVVDHSKQNCSTETFFRMKTAMTPRGGRARKLTVAVYEPLQAFMIKPQANSGPTFEGFDCDGGTNETLKMDEEIRLIHCVPFSLSSTRRGLSSSPVVASRHELDMRIRNCDESLAKALGHETSKTLHGHSLFDLIHPKDVRGVADGLRKLRQNGWSTTGYYRLLTKDSEPIWTQTEMMLLSQNVRGVEHKSVVCAHHLLSGLCLPSGSLCSKDHADFVSIELADVMKMAEMDSATDEGPSTSKQWSKAPNDRSPKLIPDFPALPPGDYGPSGTDEPSVGRGRALTVNTSGSEHFKARKVMMANLERKQRLDAKTVESFLTESSTDPSGSCAAKRKPITMDDFHLDDIYHKRAPVPSQKPNDTDPESIQRELIDHFK